MCGVGVLACCRNGLRKTKYLVKRSAERKAGKLVHMGHCHSSALPLIRVDKKAEIGWRTGRRFKQA